MEYNELERKYKKRDKQLKEDAIVKNYLRKLRFKINDLRDNIKERMTRCERKLEEHDNILTELLSRLDHA
jgi:hypothetical protein